jgi:hypothetical protein
MLKYILASLGAQGTRGPGYAFQGLATGLEIESRLGTSWIGVWDEDWRR